MCSNSTIARRAAAITTAAMTAMTRETLHWGARIVVARRFDLRVEGLDRLPRTGPVLIAARHYHHLYDGAALVAAAPRPTRIVVALDWVRGPLLRRVMETLCAAAGWPVVLRGDGPSLARGESAYRADERGAVLRRALRDTTRLLREGGLLVIFPEAYPNVDPGYTPKNDDDAFLPFDPGFVRLVEIAQRGGGARMPVVPAGFYYERGARWRVTLRFGEALFVDGAMDRAAFAAEVERRVRLLSTQWNPALKGVRPEIVNEACP